MRDETESVRETLPRAPAVRLFAPGSRVGTRYEVRSVLGTGGSASVYAAWDRDLKRLVALRVLRHDRMTERALKRFRREVAVARDGSVKLGDFGLARHWEGGDTRATETEGLVGTMEYLSPEQALGKPVDARTDLHAVGVVLHEMLTGAVPFEAGSALGGVVARLREKAPDVRAARPGVPAWLAAVVAKTLERDPARHYATAGGSWSSPARTTAWGGCRASPRSAFLPSQAAEPTPAESRSWRPLPTWTTSGWAASPSSGMPSVLHLRTRSERARRSIPPLGS